MSDRANTEYVTIIGRSFEEVVAESRAQRLGAKQFSIISPISHHQLAVVGEGRPGAEMDGQRLVVATFARRPGSDI